MIEKETLNSFNTKKGNYIKSRKKETKPYNRSQAPSPIFPFVNAELTTGKEEFFDLHTDEPKTKKYGVFTNLRITNTSAYNVVVYINQNRNNGIFISNNSSVELKRGDMGGGYTNFIISNIGAGTISASDLRMECFKEGATIDSTMKDANKLIHKAMLMIRGY